jgi:hypothetical protein
MLNGFKRSIGMTGPVMELAVNLAAAVKRLFGSASKTQRLADARLPRIDERRVARDSNVFLDRFRRQSRVAF